MSNKGSRPPGRGIPPPVADDDDDEPEDTVLDAGLPSLADLAQLGGPSDDTDTELDVPALPSELALGVPLPPRPVEARNVRGASGATLPPISDDDDDDDTFVLPRTDSKAPRQAVPLAPPARPARDLSLPSEEETARLPAPRRLGDIPAISADELEDRTLSRPRVRRATVRPSGEGSPARLLEDLGGPSLDDLPLVPPPVADEPSRPPEAPPLLAIPSTLVGPHPLEGDVSTGDASSTDEATGVLVVDAPPGAAVFVDGVERGTGHVVVEGIDPFAKVGVRVHHAGHHPWTASVSLDGEREAVVRPTLRPRD